MLILARNVPERSLEYAPSHSFAPPYYMQPCSITNDPQVHFSLDIPMILLILPLTLNIMTMTMPYYILLIASNLVYYLE